MMNPELLHFGVRDGFYPLDEEIFLSSGIAVFESQLDQISEATPDVEFLTSLPQIEICYGARTSEIFPFLLVPSEPIASLPTAREILRLLNASSFESAHIENLDAVSVPFPGCHPSPKNDEIHSDLNEQYLFLRDEEDLKDLEYDESEMSTAIESRKYHHCLRDFVIGQHLYYVLVHSVPEKHANCKYSDYVILFAVGVSPKTGNLVGVVSEQNCYNLCD